MFPHLSSLLLFLLANLSGQVVVTPDGDPGRAPKVIPPPPGREGEVPAKLSDEDWTGIRTAHEESRHAVQPTEAGHLARNAGQRWRTEFDGRGFLTRPDAGDWTWGLVLERYGFPGREEVVTDPPRVSIEGGRVAYAWSETLEEWYVNDARGLEHGFTIRQRPDRDDAGEPAPLTFTLSIRGELHPRVDDDGRDVRFLGRRGAVVLSYTGLTVVDADGKELEASFAQVIEGLRLSIIEEDARYPITIDPIARQAYLKASNTDAWDSFGCSVAVSGDTAVVGARAEDSNTTGVNGDQSDNSALSSGAAYVFVQNGTIWSQQA